MARPSGFILIAVLVLLLVLTLLASAVALVSERQLRETRTATETFASELRSTSTRETLLFLFATQRLTFGGLTIDPVAFEPRTALDEGEEDLLAAMLQPQGNEIRLDGTAYAAFGDGRFSLQDDRGLLSPNWMPPYLRQRLFEALGAPPETWGGLEAKLLDYQDADSLYRLNGAEADHYAKAGLPPPSNRPIATPFELRRILGWRELLADWSNAKLAERFTATRNVMVNLNTASADTLALLPGIDEASAARAVAMRQVTPFLSTWRFREAFPLALPDDEALILYPNNAGNLKLWDAFAGPTRLIHWTMTPFDEGGRPWRIDYEVNLPRGNDDDPGLARTPQTPLLAAPVASRP